MADFAFYGRWELREAPLITIRNEQRIIAKSLNTAWFKPDRPHAHALRLVKNNAAGIGDGYGTYKASLAGTINSGGKLVEN